MKIYLIVGDTGEYEDYAKFNSAAFKDKNEAIIYMEKLNKQLTDLGISLTPYFMHLEKSIKDISTIEDPKLKEYWIGCYGVEYSIEEMEVI